MLLVYHLSPLFVRCLIVPLRSVLEVNFLPFLRNVDTEYWAARPLRFCVELYMAP